SAGWSGLVGLRGRGTHPPARQHEKASGLRRPCSLPPAERSWSRVSDPLPSKTTGEVIRPSATVLLADVGAVVVPGIEPTAWPQRPKGCGARTVLADAMSGATDSDPSVVGPSAPLPRHGGRAVVLFVDAHAK